MRFFVGQRVRIVRVNRAVEALGKEATIVGWHVECECWELNVDGIGEWDGGEWYGMDSSQLEPITPPDEPCDADFKEQLDQLLGEHA